MYLVKLVIHCREVALIEDAECESIVSYQIPKNMFILFSCFTVDSS